MENETKGIGFTGILLTIFIVLKSTNLIAWSWWWVLSPIWLPIAIAFAVGLLLIILGLLEDV